jgi:hypothetical protein
LLGGVVLVLVSVRCALVPDALLGIEHDISGTRKVGKPDPVALYCLCMTALTKSKSPKQLEGV